MKLEEYIEMFEQSIQVHQRYIDEQSKKLFTLNAISKNIKTLTTKLSCYKPLRYSNEIRNLINLFYDIDAQRNNILNNISERTTEIYKLEREIIKLKARFYRKGE